MTKILLTNNSDLHRVGSALNQLDFNTNEMGVTSSNRTALVSVGDLSRRLQLAALGLTDGFVSPDGKQVDYLAMKHSLEFREFVFLTAQLRLCSIQELW